MIYSYFQTLNWQLMQSKIWKELIRACALSMDAVLPDIGTVRDLYLPWVSPDEYAGSRGIFKLPHETTADYRKRIISAYSFWEKIHSPAHLETLLDGDVNEYENDIWAEFSFRFNQAIAQEDIETFLYFLNEIKPARSRLKGVIVMSDTFLVSSEHHHTGGEDGALISHNSLADAGSMTHDALEQKIDNDIGLVKSIETYRRPRCMYAGHEESTGTHSIGMTFVNHFDDVQNPTPQTYKQYYEVEASAVFGGNYGGQSGNHSIGMELIIIEADGRHYVLVSWQKTTAQHYASLIGEKTIHWASDAIDKQIGTDEIVALRTTHTRGSVKNRRIKVTPVVYCREIASPI